MTVVRQKMNISLNVFYLKKICIKMFITTAFAIKKSKENVNICILGMGK